MNRWPTDSPGLLHRTAPPHHTAPRLTAEQYRVLEAVADRQIVRGYLLGDFEPYLLDGRDVIRPLRGLVLRGLVRLRPIGPPDLTARGRLVLNGPD